MNFKNCEHHNMTFQNPKLACTAEPHCKTTIRSPVHHSFDLVITNLQSYTGWLSMQYISDNKLAHMSYNGYQFHHIVHAHFNIHTILVCAQGVQTTWKTHPCLNVNRTPKKPNKSPPKVQTAIREVNLASDRTTHTSCAFDKCSNQPR